MEDGETELESEMFDSDGEPLGWLYGLMARKMVVPSGRQKIDDKEARSGFGGGSMRMNEPGIPNSRTIESF